MTPRLHFMFLKQSADLRLSPVSQLPAHDYGSSPHFLDNGLGRPLQGAAT